MTQLDYDAIRKRLTDLKSQTNKSSFVWKPKEGKHVLRIVPYKFNPGNPFIELYFYYEFGKKSYLSLKSFGETDPIETFCNKLRRTGEKSDWLEAVKLEPKPRTFVPIVVRGEEEKGVRFWGFGKEVYETLMGFVLNPDWGNIIDPLVGHDIEIEFVKKVVKEKTIIVPKPPTPNPKEKPITTNQELMDKILNEQKEIFEVYPKNTAAELMEVLDKYLNPTAEEEAGSGNVPPQAPANGVSDEGAPTTPAPEAASAKPAKKQSAPAVASTENVEDAFKKMFESADTQGQPKTAGK